MVVEQQAQLLSLEALMALPEDETFEIINGESILMAPAGGRHQIIASNILHILQVYVRKNGIGVVLPDQMTYLMHSEASGLKDAFVPDVSFLSTGNVPEAWDIDKPHPGAPNLAIEIISPNDNADKVQQKTRTYLDKGTQEVWLLYPKSREVHQFRADSIEAYQADAIDAEALFPGIEGLTIDAIFDLPAMFTQPAGDADTQDTDNEQT